MFSTNKWKIVSNASGKRRPRRFTKAGSDTRVFVQPKCSISSQVILLPFKDRIRVINFAKGSLTFLVKSLPGERANSHETALTERIALYRVSRIQIALLDISRRMYCSCLYTSARPPLRPAVPPSPGAYKVYSLEKVVDAVA